MAIRGPKSVIDSISKVEASVSVSGLSEDVVTKSELVLYDSDNNVIDQSLLANNLGTEGVSVSVQVLETKSVKVEFDTSQITAADGYSVSDIKYEPDHLNVTGRAEELKKLGREDIVVIAGGVIPAQDYDFLYKAGVAAIFGPGTPVAKAACQILEILMDEE